MPYNNVNITLRESFYKPLFEIYAQSEKQYKCTDISDLQYAMLGIDRCLSQSKSGHDFIQKRGDDAVASEGKVLSVSHFFKALKSKRRLTNLSSLNDLLRDAVKERISDPFASFEELDKWDVYAVDGHYQKSACHDPVYENRKGELSHASTGHFFRLNLRTHHMSVLDTTQPDLDRGRKKEHDARLIKRMTAEQMRYGAKKGRRVLLVWDKACIDYKAWHHLKHNNGVYFLTMEKSNTAAMTCSIDLCDHSEPRNEGILSVENVGISGEIMRRIRYRNPMDGHEYCYLTNEMTLPAHLIVAFYKHRWDIEKVYYQFKTKFEERKSWATGYTAKKAHATFECLLHNLLLLMEERIHQEEEIVDHQSQNIAKGRKRATPKGFINKIVNRASHRTLKFIRWLRNHLNNKASYTCAIMRLKTLYTQQI